VWGKTLFLIAKKTNLNFRSYLVFEIEQELYYFGELCCSRSVKALFFFEVDELVIGFHSQQYSRLLYNDIPHVYFEVRSRLQPTITHFNTFISKIANQPHYTPCEK